jgi:hypothetical protein
MSSASEAVVSGLGTLTTTEISLRRERRFFSGMAILLLLACFAGFAPSYYLKSMFGSGPLTALVHVHGALFSAWILLLVVQTSLIAARRVDLHRKLGLAGGVLAVSLLVTGAFVIWNRAITTTPALPHDFILRFLALSVTALAVFPTLIGLALYFRRNAGAHKRLIMLATIVMTGAAIHRLLIHVLSPTVNPLVFFGATDLFIVALCVFDLASRKRLHPATRWGGLLVVASQIVGVGLAASDGWVALAHRVTGV